MNKPTLSSSTVWGHSQDCPAAINSDFECKCKVDTTTQGNDIDKNNLINEKDKEAKIHGVDTTLDSKKVDRGLIEGRLDDSKHAEESQENQHTTTDMSEKPALDTKLDSRSLGDDSMKEQIEEVLRNRVTGIDEDQWGRTVQTYLGAPVELIDELSALFQSQESKTLERVREKILDKFFTENGYMREDIPHEIIEDIEKVFEAEQKGSKNG